MKASDRLQEKETFLRLLNLEMNDTIERWSDEPENLPTYAWGYRQVYEDGVVIGSNHSDCFYHADEVIKLAKAFGYRCYLRVVNNEDGEPTPCVAVHFM